MNDADAWKDDKVDAEEKSCSSSATWKLQIEAKQTQIPIISPTTLTATPNQNNDEKLDPKRGIAFVSNISNFYNDTNDEECSRDSRTEVRAPPKPVSVGILTIPSEIEELPDAKIASQVKTFQILRVCKHDTLIFAIIDKIFNSKTQNYGKNSFNDDKYAYSFEMYEKWFELTSKRVKYGILVCIIAMLLDYSVNDMFLKSIIVATFLGAIIGIVLIYYILNCNFVIMKEGLTSLIVWYKIVHTIIATIARFVLRDFLIANEKYRDINGDKYPFAFYLFCLINTAATVEFVMILSLIDAFAIENTKYKRILLFVGIIYFGYLWASLYFNTYDIDDPWKKQVTIELAGTSHSFYWRSICLLRFVYYVYSFLFLLYFFFFIFVCNEKFGFDSKKPY